MSLKKVLLISSFLGLSVVFSGYIYESSQDKSLKSPLPFFLNIFDNNQVSTVDYWKPTQRNVLSYAASNVELSAQAALIYDLTQDEELYEKNSEIRLPIASLTKIMTAVIALENKKQDDRYYVSKSDLVGENSMGLTPGEVLTLEELLYGLILPSGNDAAEVLASSFVGGREEFVKAMNQKASSLGLENTNFTNPSGLEGDGKQYSTASDLLVIARYAIKNFPLFREVVSAVEKEIPYTSNHKYFYLYNETNLLTSYPGVRGVKTGYTPEAGLCLVTYLDYEGHEIIGVLLGSENRRQEMKDLLDYSLRLEGINPPPHQ
ncbi:MAG: Peptidase S11 D-alanyl-D-alanine carboxypeptidase 1 [Candidatus Levybacteria bacterium GW2011_GWA2_40_8]|nr:MAG: Peptidase S11 D-alanyl-D-alanine carboxypeptidase 1 [Candidatus Levybacteria bacterium GW2011_GWA2_40_8]